MNPTVKIQLKIGTSNPETPLGAEVWMDQTKHFETEHVKQDTAVTIDLEEDNHNHELRVIMKNKLPEHTKIDDNGAIFQDSVLTVSDVSFEDIELGHLFNTVAVYSHDFNGTGDSIETQCFGRMGCNGTLSLKFSTPVYLWLLENM